MVSHSSARSVAAAVLFAVAAGCGPGDRVRDLDTRAVVVGIDGADWKVIEGLAADGGMPNLMALRERGVWGEIETLREMPLSPAIWTSVATGRSAADHGISWFLVDQPDGTRVPVRSGNRRVKAIWNILAERRRSATVVGWWATYPAEDLGKGMMVSDALGFHGFGATAREGDDGRKTWPPGLFARVDRLVPPVRQITAEYATRFVRIEPEEYRRLMYTPAADRHLDPLNPIHLFQLYAATAEGYTAIAEQLLADPYDLFMVYFEQVDSFSHLFMKYAEPPLAWVDPELQTRFAPTVLEWYRHQDELLGRLLEAIDLDTTAVFVLSDHGFKRGERRIRSEATVDVRRAHLDHETHGIFIAAGPHLGRGARIDGASVLDLAPTVLHYLGFPVAEEMEGRVLSRLFETAFLTDHPVRYIASYEDGAGEPAAPPGEDPADPGASERRLEALRTLGYVGAAEGGADRDGDPGSGGAAGTSPEMLTNLGRIHLGKGDLEAAQRQFARALALAPDHAEALLAIGEVYRLQGRVAEAEHVVKRALRVDPNSMGALAQLAEIARDRGDLDEAVRLFEEALAIDDALPFLFLGYGDVLQRAGRHAEAERAFRAVLELDPDSFKAYYNLGVTYANQDRLDDAVVAYGRALELDPRHPEAAKALNNLGAIHQARGQVDRAAERFEQAASASPYNLEARFNLAVIYLARDRVPEAVALLEQAAAIEPDHELVSLQLGMAFLRAGRTQDAYKSLLLVRRLYPGNWQAVIGLALVHARSGQPERARELITEAVRLGGDAARRQIAANPLLARLS